MIKENLETVRANVHKAIEKSGRNDSDVLLIAVSKTKPVEDLMEAYDAGVRDFGENKVQELVDKYEVMPKDARFHMIGHLQKNKVKYLIGKTCLIHSVDSFELAKVIQKESEKNNVITDVLIEVNVAKEDTKFGVFKEDLLNLVKEVSTLKNVRIKGLMTIAPFVENPEDNRQYFNELKRLGIDIESQNIDNVSMGTYSMGMTGDYEVAIEEGATMVRVGTGIFGVRNYSLV
ncbi:MAG: YggS family pyridoxal phosphate-dependent enzyme [Lachnospiraceae bacterium]|jgi:pyridoxal phosphate enzyme (YggS family)|nr:YggS family pyridoxal phosphate-dependent enzyme [Lachnospiraceae bacterium]